MFLPEHFLYSHMPLKCRLYHIFRRRLRRCCCCCSISSAFSISHMDKWAMENVYLISNTIKARQAYSPAFIFLSGKKITTTEHWMVITVILIDGNGFATQHTIQVHFIILLVIFKWFVMDNISMDILYSQKRLWQTNKHARTLSHDTHTTQCR